VTPVYHGARFIEETIRSIVYQGYPNLEYMVVDGGSTDGTVEIIRKYEKHISWWVSRRDKGVYDALSTGFSHSTGDIMGWLNASDLLHTNGLFVVGSVFASLRAVEWLTGRPTRFNPHGMTVDIRTLPSWSRYRFLAGANKHIQQESTFWRRSLWEKAGGELNAAYRDAISTFGCDFSVTPAFTPWTPSLEGTAFIPTRSAPRTCSAIMKGATKLLRGS
jgi:glycosyltransferase involved in cell wall biosynthesis